MNINVTSPGATLALGMVFFDSGNETIAQWMTAPTTIYTLNQVKLTTLNQVTSSVNLCIWQMEALTQFPSNRPL